MKHYKYWEDEDGYIRGATWDDETPLIETLMFDTLAEVRCGGQRFMHGGSEAAREAFAEYPGEDMDREKFNRYVAPFAGFRRLGSNL